MGSLFLRDGIPGIIDFLQFQQLGVFSRKEFFPPEIVDLLEDFPPFPPGSEGRIQLLRNFAAFRKLIDQLTIPPGEESGGTAENS